MSTETDHSPVVNRLSSCSINTKYSDCDAAEHPAQGTFLQCWTVMAKTMIGVALLGLSSAVAVSGWFVGSILLLAAAAAAMFTLHLLNCMIMQSHKRHVSFYVVAERVAPWCRWLVDVAIAVKSLGVGTAYFQIYANEMASFIERVSDNSVNSKMSGSVLRFLIIVGGLLLMIPICFRKSVSKTAIINVFGILGVTYIVIVGVVYTDLDYTGSPPGSADTTTSFWPTGSFAAIAAKIPIFIFTFTCHQNMFLVGEDMKHRSQRKLDLVAFLAEAAGICLFIPAMIFPYITYGKSVSSNFLASMNNNDEIGKSPAVLCGSLAIAIAEISAFPLQLFPCRKSLMVLVTKGKVMSVKQEKVLRRIFTAVILLVTCVIAMFVTDLGITLSLVGIIGSNTICFVMPTYLYCQAFNKKITGAVDNNSVSAATVTRDSSVGETSDDTKPVIKPLQAKASRISSLINSNINLKWYVSAFVCGVTTALLPICLTSIIYVTVTK